MKKKQNPSSHHTSTKPGKIWQKFLWLPVLIMIGLGIWGLNQRYAQETDLSLVGKGQNVVVQVHDPGCPHCRELKRVVDLLKPEYEGKIRFVIADLTTDEGRGFAQYHRVNRVTLVFFRPDGTKIATLEGEQTEDFLRKAFNRTFQL